MMLRLIVIVGLWCMCIPNKVHAQYCGSNPEFIPFDYSFYRHDLKDGSKSIQGDTVAITFHIVESVAGDGGVSTTDLENEIRSLNNIFLATGIRFFMCGSQRFIQGNDSYDFAAGNVLNQGNHVANTINVYFVNDLTDANLNPLCGYAVFPWTSQPSTRYIVMQKGCIGAGKVLSHELGHFFGLLHTHERANGLEFVNGSNCSRAGDLLGDTPADPQVDGSNVSAGVYTGFERDPNGDIYMPNPSNLMSYAPTQCQRTFTEEQSDVMGFFMNTEFAYLKRNCDDFPDYSLSIDPLDLTLKSGEEFSIHIEANAVALKEAIDMPVFFYLSQDKDILGQIIEKKSIHFDLDNQFYEEDILIQFPLDRSSGTYYFSAVIDAEFAYIERTEDNNQDQFQIQVDNSSFSDVVLFPNPVRDRIRFFMRSSTDQRDFSIQFSDINGRLFKIIKGFKNSFEFLNEFDISDLPPGLYAVSVRFDRSGSTFPFIIIKED